MSESTAICRSPIDASVTVERIDDALDVVATAVERFGDAYMPIFMRLEEERSALINRSGAIDRVRRRLETNRAGSRV